MEQSAPDLERHAYSIAVDLVDGMLKGATTDQWKGIYERIRAAAEKNRTISITRGGEIGMADARAWSNVMDTLDIAIESMDI